MKEMRKRVWLTLVVAFMAAAVLTGCKSKDTESGKKTATEKNVDPLADWKPEEELKKIQGTMYVEGNKWVVDGDKVSITRGSKTKEGTLELTYPCQIRVLTPMGGGANSIDKYGYARNGEDIYIGFGTMGMKFGDKYIAGKRGAILFDGKECQYFARQLGMKRLDSPVDVKGGLTEKEGKTYFEFEIPDRFTKGEFDSFSLEVVGTALLDGHAKRNLIKR